MTATCPYCGNETFYSLPKQEQRHSELSVADETEWINKCVNCNDWSVHHDNDSKQYELLDKTDPTSIEK